MQSQKPPRPSLFSSIAPKSDNDPMYSLDQAGFFDPRPAPPSPEELKAKLEKEKALDMALVWKDGEYDHAQAIRCAQKWGLVRG